MANSRLIRSHSSRLVRGSKRHTFWFGFGVASTTLSATGGTIIYNLNAGALALRPFTVVRTISEFFLSSDQAAAIETQQVAFGWAVVSDQASAIGVSAVPTPTTDLGSELWFFHKFIFGDESNLTDRTRSGQRVSVESRAMRKVDEGQDVVGVAELDAGSTGAALVTGGRMLIKLH